MILSVSSKIGLIGLILSVFSLVGMAHAISAWETSDIVYSARYYKPGSRQSHHKIWRINSSGSGLMQVTSGNTEDHSPIWLADGKNILFVRKTAKTSKLCTVGERGGGVTELAVLPKGYVFIESVAPNRRSVVYLVQDSKWKLVLFDIATRKKFPLGAGNTTAWSPNSRRLYISPWGESNLSALILDLKTRGRLPLTGDFRAAAWLNDQTLSRKKSLLSKSRPGWPFYMSMVQRSVRSSCRSPGMMKMMTSLLLPTICPQFRGTATAFSMAVTPATAQRAPRRSSIG